MRILLVAATAAEIAPALQVLGLDSAANPAICQHQQREVHLCITGVGLMATTFSLTKALLSAPYDFVLQAGIGGAFDTSLPLGSLVTIHSEMLGDLGAEDHEQFIDIFTMGFVEKDTFPFRDGRLVNPLQHIPVTLENIPSVSGVTVHTVSGHAPTIAARTARLDAAVESMEGAALHYVCLRQGIPFLQLRAISNYVTPRNRAAWEIGKAIKALNDQLIHWLQ